MKKNEFSWKMCRDWLDLQPLRLYQEAVGRSSEGLHPIVMLLGNEHITAGVPGSTWGPSDWWEIVEQVATKLGLDPPWEPDETWSKSIADMTEVECCDVAFKIGCNITIHRGINHEVGLTRYFAVTYSKLGPPQSVGPGLAFVSGCTAAHQGLRQLADNTERLDRGKVRLAP